jgi:hypothetical protein
MGERQEKVWVVMRYTLDTGNGCGDNWPVKVFDDRKDARKYVATMNSRSRRYGYELTGAKKG